MSQAAANIRIGWPSLIGGEGRALFAFWLLLLMAGQAPTKAQEYAKSIPTALNATGKVVTIPVPLTAGGVVLGDIVVAVEPDDSVAIPKAALLSRLGPLLDAAAAARLSAVPDENGNFSPQALVAAGFDVKFDPSQLTLAYQPRGPDRAASDLSLRSESIADNAARAATVRPALVSGFVNFGTSLDHTWGNTAITDQSALTFDVQPVLRISQVVLAADWGYKSAAEPFICPRGAYCLKDQAAGFKRAYTRAIFDLPEDRTRLELGDTEPLGTDFQNATDTLGLSLEHSSRKLAPGENLGPSGGSAFRLDRPSDVDVIVNGAVVRHMHLAPGPYNLKDIPLQSGSNEVTLEITDDTGQHHSQTFNTVFDGTLLAPGTSEWALSAGVPSYLSDNERVYRSTYLTGTAFYRQGLNNALTGEIQAQADNDVAETGGRLLAGLPVGFVTLGTAASVGRLGAGFAANANWSLPNARIVLRGSHSGRETLAFGADYRSSRYHTPGEYLATATGVFYPIYDYSWRFNGFYSAPLTETIAFNLSGHYAIGSGASANATAPYTFADDRYGLDMALSAALNSWMNGSLTVGYGNDSYLDPARRTAEFHAAFRLTLRPDQHSNIEASYDSANREATILASTDARSGANHWDASVQVDHSNLQASGTAGASVGYRGNRFEARVSQLAGYDDGTFAGGGSSTGIQRTTLTAGTAIAFADGKFAFGAPVRGDAFAIVYPHGSLAGKDIAVGDTGNLRGYADSLGPALVGDIGAYTPTSLSVDVADLPLGYSLGQGTFDLKADYRSGYALEVGSAHSISAYGTLMGADSQPIALETGTATLEGEPAHQVAVFTNASGRFGADGLAPGRWVIEMAGREGPARFAIDIPAGTNGLFRAGTLTAVGGPG